MPRQRVVAVRLSRSNVFGLILLLMSFTLTAQPISPQGYLARIDHDSPEDVAKALERVEMLYEQGKLEGIEAPSLILHGPEVEVFFKDTYDRYKGIVDLAQKLSDLDLVDVRVCETQTGVMGREASGLYPFVKTVPFGPREVNRLLEQQNYVYF